MRVDHELKKSIFDNYYRNLPGKDDNEIDNSPESMPHVGLAVDKAPFVNASQEKLTKEDYCEAMIYFINDSNTLLKVRFLCQIIFVES